MPYVNNSSLRSKFVFSYKNTIEKPMNFQITSTLSANLTKWSNTLKQFVGKSVIWSCLIILWGWRLKG